MLPIESAYKLYVDRSGKPLDEGYIYFGLPNMNPETAPVTVYWDADGTQPAAQPLRTMNGYIVRNGTPANVFYSASYSQLVFDKKRRQVYYARNSEDYSIATIVNNFLSSLASSIGSSLIGFIQSGVGAILRNVQAKLRESYASPEDFGGVGDGSDNTSAIQNALNTGKNIWLTQGRIYGISAELSSTFPNIKITGGGTIKFLASYDMSGGTLSALAVTGENTTLDSVIFDGSDIAVGAATNNRFVWCTVPRLKVTENASFISLPKGGGNFNGAIGCNQTAPYSRVLGAYFNSNPGAVFFQGRNCVANNNVIIDPNDVAIALNSTSCYGCEIVGNTINNEALNSCSALIAAEEGASQWVIEGNTLFGIKDGAGISALNVAVFTTVRGGTIRGNKINGGSGVTTNPCAGIAVSDRYTRVEVEGNDIYGLPTGNAATRLVIVPSNGGALRGNVIDGTSATDVSAMVDINAGVLGIDIDNNTSIAAAGRRHYLLGAGDYAGFPVTFIGGRYYGGAEGINAELNAGSIVNLSLHIRDIVDKTVTNIVNASTILGSRHDWLNAGAWARPCFIGTFTDMYGTGVPVSGTFQNGDRVHYLTPAAGTPEGIIRVAGVWRDLANIS